MIHSLLHNSLFYGDILSIRQALIGDAHAIKQLVSSLSHFYLESEGGSLPVWFENTLNIAEFERRLSSGKFTHFVYLSNNNVVGYISIKEGGRLYHLFVDGSYQGKGVAKKLWRFSTSRLNEKVYTVRSSIYAVPVYKSFGFEVSGELASKEGIHFQPMRLQFVN